MDHAHVNDIGLFLLQEDLYPTWPQVITVTDRKAPTIKQVLGALLFRNRVHKKIVMDNAPTFFRQEFMLMAKTYWMLPKQGTTARAAT